MSTPSRVLNWPLFCAFAIAWTHTQNTHRIIFETNTFACICPRHSAEIHIHGRTEKLRSQRMSCPARFLNCNLIFDFTSVASASWIPNAEQVEAKSHQISRKHNKKPNPWIVYEKLALITVGRKLARGCVLEAFYDCLHSHHNISWWSFLCTARKWAGMLDVLFFHNRSRQQWLSVDDKIQLSDIEHAS